MHIVTNNSERESQFIDVTLEFEKEISFSLANLIFKLYGGEKGYDIATQMVASQGIQDIQNLHVERVIIQIDRIN